jgi:DnaJ-class molecular chaperone
MPGTEKTFEPATCCHCDGEGCLYCNKTGTVLVLSPKTFCKHCEGVGCIYCGFTGWTGPKSKCD